MNKYIKENITSEIKLQRNHFTAVMLAAKKGLGARNFKALMKLSSPSIKALVATFKATKGKKMTQKHMLELYRAYVDAKNSLVQIKQRCYCLIIAAIVSTRLIVFIERFQIANLAKH